MRIAVTGASGFIGSRLSARLREDGFDVVPVARPLDTDRVVESCKGADAIVHLAALLHGPTESLMVANVVGTAAVARAANILGIRLVHVSSVAASGSAPASHPRVEDDPPVPINAYGISKLESERWVIAAGGSWTIVRPAIVYGPGDRQFLQLFRLANRGRFIRPPRPGASYSLIYVDDVVEALVLAATRKEAEHHVMFLAHPTLATSEEVLQTLARTFNRTYRPLAFPLPVMKAAALAGSVIKRATGLRLFDRARLREMQLPGFACRVDRAREVLGFEARTGLVEGFALTAAWYRDQGWLTERP